MKGRSSKALIFYKNKVLLILRDDIPTISDPNKWNLPGGGIDEGETSDEAMTRELQEEINMVPRELISVGKLDLGDHITNVYISEIEEEELNKISLGNEGQKLGFFSYEEVKEMELTSSMSNYLSKYQELFKKMMVSENKKSTLSTLFE